MRGMSKSIHKSRRLRGRAFGNLCEQTEGGAKAWRQLGCTDAEILAFAEDCPFVLFEVVPLMHALGFSEEDVLRHVPHAGLGTWAGIGLLHFIFMRNPLWALADGLPIPVWALAAYLRRALTRRIAAARNAQARPAHYAVEKARRQAMAAERRRVRRRTTTSPCPGKEELLEAWRHVRDTKESLVRFGSLMQDLECYVDNSLKFDESGQIVGRNAGIKGWLHENLPELAAHYCTVMRYKAAAKKLRQIVGLTDPVPVAAVLPPRAGEAEGGIEKGKGESCARDYGAEKFDRTGENRTGKAKGKGEGGLRDYGAEKFRGVVPPVEVVRARAVYLEVMEGVPDVAARVLARIDALCDPDRTDEAATLRSWREKYAQEITEKRKASWWRRLIA